MKTPSLKISNSFMKEEKEQQQKNLAWEENYLVTFIWYQTVFLKTTMPKPRTVKQRSHYKKKRKGFRGSKPEKKSTDDGDTGVAVAGKKTLI